jgi:hypothetical protein
MVEAQTLAPPLAFIVGRGHIECPAAPQGPHHKKYDAKILHFLLQLFPGFANIAQIVFYDVSSEIGFCYNCFVILL